MGGKLRKVCTGMVQGMHDLDPAPPIGCKQCLHDSNIVLTRINQQAPCNVVNIMIIYVPQTIRWQRRAKYLWLGFEQFRGLFKAILGQIYTKAMMSTNTAGVCADLHEKSMKALLKQVRPTFSGITGLSSEQADGAILCPEMTAVIGRTNAFLQMQNLGCTPRYDCSYWPHKCIHANAKLRAHT